jgi:hypothetical protein
LPGRWADFACVDEMKESEAAWRYAPLRSDDAENAERRGDFLRAVSETPNLPR